LRCRLTRTPSPHAQLAHVATPDINLHFTQESQHAPSPRRRSTGGPPDLRRSNAVDVQLRSSSNATVRAPMDRIVPTRPPPAAPPRNLLLLDDPRRRLMSLRKRNLVNLRSRIHPPSRPREQGGSQRDSGYCEWPPRPPPRPTINCANPDHQLRRRETPQGPAIPASLRMYLMSPNARMYPRCQSIHIGFDDSRPIPIRARRRARSGQ
jgi:hypothetical protein